MANVDSMGKQCQHQALSMTKKWSESSHQRHLKHILLVLSMQTSQTFMLIVRIQQL